MYITTTSDSRRQIDVDMYMCCFSYATNLATSEASTSELPSRRCRYVMAFSADNFKYDVCTLDEREE